MTEIPEKKTLTIRPADERTDAPALQRKGRGWNVAESRLDTLHEAARGERRNPTPAQEALAAGLIAANLGKFRMKRHVVIGSAIVDFACQPLKLVVSLDRAGVDPVIAQRGDRNLATVGLKVLRFDEAAVLADVEGVVAAIVAEMKTRYTEQRSRPRPGVGGRPSGSRAAPSGRGQRQGQGQGYQR